MEIHEVEGYDAAKAEYDGSIVAARAAGDELGELRAQLAWRDKQDGFRQQRDTLVAAAAATERALADAKTKYPNAPEVVYSGLKDPASIEAAAKQAHEAIVAATGQQQQGQQFRQPSQPWPQPPAGNPPPPAGDHAFDDPVAWAEHMEKIKNQPKPPNQGINNKDFQKAMDFVVDRLWQNPLKNSQQ